MKRFCGRDFSGREMRRLCELIGEDLDPLAAQLLPLGLPALGLVPRWPQGDEHAGDGHACIGRPCSELPPPRNPKGGSGPSRFLAAHPQPLLSRLECTSCPACIWR